MALTRPTFAQIRDATSANNLVSNSVSAVSAQVVLNSAQMTSADNALSNAISAVSAAVASVESHVNTVSNAVSVISQQVSVLSARVASNSVAMVLAYDAVSNAVSIVSAAQLDTWNAVSNEISARQATSAALETHINTVSNAASVISVAVASVESHVNTVSNAVSIVSAQLVSVDSKLSNAISALSNAVSTTYAQKSGATFTGDVVISATLSVRGDAHFSNGVNVDYSSGDEGGQINMAQAATNSTLDGDTVTFDIWQNRVRFFEQGGLARGAYIDLSLCGAGVGTNLLAGGGGGTASATSADLASVENKLSNLVSVVSAAQLSTWNAVSNEISVRAAASADLKSAINVVSNAISVVSAAQLSTWNKVSAILTSSQTFSGSTYGFSNTLQRNSRNVVTNYTGVSAPGTPLVGDEWYYTTSDILYKYIYDGTNYAWVDLTSPLYNTATAATANTIALRDSGGNLTATNFLGVASSAKYADLAEIYSSDITYVPGTVVVLGGTKEITQSTQSYDTKIAGVISDKPAYLMNSAATGLAVALMGRVPCLVTGKINKGDRLVSSYKPGHAMKMNIEMYEPGSIIGKSLQDFEGESGVVEIMVGRT